MTELAEHTESKAAVVLSSRNALVLASLARKLTQYIRRKIHVVDNLQASILGKRIVYITHCFHEDTNP